MNKVKVFIKKHKTAICVAVAGVTIGLIIPRDISDNEAYKEGFRNGVFEMVDKMFEIAIDVENDNF